MRTNTLNTCQEIACTHSRSNELPHALRQSTSQTPQRKDGVRHQHAWLAAKNVTQLAVERLARGHGKKVAVWRTLAT